MNTFKKSLVAVLTVATISGATVSTAHAGGKWWKKSVATGVGVGLGLGIAGALIRPRGETIYVQQPSYQPHCYWQAQTFYGPYGPYTKNVKYCQ